jgi:hypothetical protein
MCRFRASSKLLVAVVPLSWTLLTTRSATEYVLRRFFPWALSVVVISITSLRMT